jgi:hypothetical protein
MPMFMPKRRHMVQSDEMDARLGALDAEVLHIPTGDLRVDLGYQNPLETALVASMGVYIPCLAGQLLVVRRPDGSLLIADGYHRWSRAMLDGVATVECRVVNVDDHDLEAYIFVRANSSTGQKASFALWHGWLDTHDPRALEVQSILASFDIAIGRRPVKGTTIIGCPWTVCDMYDRGTLKQVCKVLTTVLPSPAHGYTRTHFEGIEVALAEGLTPAAIKYVFDTVGEVGVESAMLAFASVTNNRSKARKFAGALRHVWLESRRPRLAVSVDAVA